MEEWFFVVVNSSEYKCIGGLQVTWLIQGSVFVLFIFFHKTPIYPIKGCQHFLLNLLVKSFHRSVKFYYQKIHVMCCTRGRHEKKIKIKEFVNTLLFLHVIYQWKFWPISLKTISSTDMYPINLFKEEGFSQRMSPSFRLLKIHKHATTSQRDISTQKSASQWTNRTEPQAFTVCNLELYGKVIVLQSGFQCTHFRLVVNNNGQNRREQCATKQKEIEEQLPEWNYKEALLTDMKSKIESIWYTV